MPVYSQLKLIFANPIKLGKVHDNIWANTVKMACKQFSASFLTKRTVIKVILVKKVKPLTMKPLTHLTHLTWLTPIN